MVLPAAAHARAASTASAASTFAAHPTGAAAHRIAMVRSSRRNLSIPHRHNL